MLPTIDCRSSLDSLHYSIVFTLIRLKLDPRLQAYVPAFEELRSQWSDISMKEHQLVGERLEAEAKVDYVDAALNRTSDGIAYAVLLETKNDRKAPLFVRYFGNQPPSRFRRPILGAQLTAMRTWVPSLKESGIPALVAYGDALEPQIAEADAAMMSVSVAEQKIIDFRAFGERKQFFDKVNGARKLLHGEVAKMVHAHPEWSLTRNYVEALFQHESAPAEPSDTELDEEIEAKKSEVDALIALREARAKDKQAEAALRREIEKKAKLAAIAKAEEAAKAAAAKVAALKGEITPDA